MVSSRTQKITEKYKDVSGLPPRVEVENSLLKNKKYNSEMKEFYLIWDKITSLGKVAVNEWSGDAYDRQCY